MNIEEYQKIIEQTAVYPKQVDNFGLAYCYLGFQGELHEAITAIKNKDFKNAQKEKGDVIWYITAFCNELKLNLNDVFNTSCEFIYDLDLLYQNTMQLSENIKKYYRDGKAIDTSLFLSHFYSTIKALFINSHINFIDRNYEPVLEDILQMNYNKLIARRATNTLHGDGDNREVTS